MPGDRFIELAMGKDRQVLDVLFRHAFDAVTVQDTSGRLVYANDKAAHLIGFSSAEIMLATPVSELAAAFDIVDSDGAIVPVDDLPGRRVLAGEVVVEQVLGYRRAENATVRWSRVNASPIKNDARETVLVVNFIADITQQVRTEAARRLLGSAHEVLGASLDIEQLLEQLARLIVPELAGWCAVHLVGDDGRLSVFTVLFPQGEKETFVNRREVQGIVVDGNRIESRVVRTMQPEIIVQMTDETLLATEGLAPFDFQAFSVACLPLRLGKHAIGALTVARSKSTAPFDATDIELLMSIADRAAISIENARLYQHEHEVSETLQRALMPRFLPQIPGVELAARYRPLTRLGHVGGDFYDVLPVSSDRWALVVGDIEGKGPPAAAAVGLAHHTVRATISLDPSPSTVIRALNKALRAEGDGRMCTLAYLLLERRGESFKVDVALAGHPPPVIVTSQGEKKLIGRPCPPAGVVPSIEPIIEQSRLSRGDTLILYTDGFALPSMTSPESITAELGAVNGETVHALLTQLLDKLEDAHGSGVPDDVALLAARVNGARAR